MSWGPCFFSKIDTFFDASYIGDPFIFIFAVSKLPISSRTYCLYGDCNILIIAESDGIGSSVISLSLSEF